LCYDNFVVEQKNFNGAPGLAPDKVHVRSEAHLHTRSCLVVNYCAKTGFYLISRASSTAAAWGKIFEVACLFDFEKQVRLSWHPHNMEKPSLNGNPL